MGRGVISSARWAVARSKVDKMDGKIMPLFFMVIIINNVRISVEK